MTVIGSKPGRITIEPPRSSVGKNIAAPA